MTTSLQLDRTDRALLDTLQGDLPLESRPWLAVAGRLGISENDVIARLERLSAAGIIRGIGPVLESRPLGLHAGTLVALRAPEERIDDIATIVSRCPEVSHNFRRDHEYAIWFTVTARDRQAADRIIAGILGEAGIAASDCLELPTVKKVKIDVRFPVMDGKGRAE